MTLTAPTGEPFHFVLMRERLVDTEGRPIDESGPDPEAWLLAEALRENAPSDIVGLGPGQLTVDDADAREFVAEHFLGMEADAGVSYVRATLTMAPGVRRQPSMGDLVAVLVPDGGAVLFEVLLSAEDLNVPTDPEATVFVQLRAGEAILQSRPDLGLVDTSAGEASPEGSHAVH